MSNLMVYHGSSVVVSSPSLTYGRTDADFGLGFYVSKQNDDHFYEKKLCILKTLCYNSIDNWENPTIEIKENVS